MYPIDPSEARRPKLSTAPYGRISKINVITGIIKNNILFFINKCTLPYTCLTKSNIYFRLTDGVAFIFLFILCIVYCWGCNEILLYFIVIYFIGYYYVFLLVSSVLEIGIDIIIFVSSR